MEGLSRSVPPAFVFHSAFQGSHLQDGIGIFALRVPLLGTAIPATGFCCCSICWVPDLHLHPSLSAQLPSSPFVLVSYDCVEDTLNPAHVKYLSPSIPHNAAFCIGVPFCAFCITVFCSSKPDMSVVSLSSWAPCLINPYILLSSSRLLSLRLCLKCS